MIQRFASHAELAAHAATRPAGYLDELMKAAVERTDKGVTFDAADPVYQNMFKRYRQQTLTQHAERTGTLVASVPLTAAKREPIEVRGPALWAKLHRRPLEWEGGDDTKWLRRFHRDLGCGDCAAHWHTWLKANPPDFSSRDAYFAWTVAGHNAVNAALGKPAVPLEEARRLHGY